jgi:hypothetical protein
LGDDDIGLPAAGADQPHCVPTQLLATWENPRDRAGILAHLAASQLFTETMDKGLAATTKHGRTQTGLCLPGAPAPPPHKPPPATHSDELFAVNESRRSWRARALLNSGKPGAEGTWVEILVIGIDSTGSPEIAAPQRGRRLAVHGWDSPLRARQPWQGRHSRVGPILGSGASKAYGSHSYNPRPFPTHG